MTRKEILDAADKCVNGQREQDYGTPENNFGTIATLWNAYLGHPFSITAVDVAAMMALLKIARISNGGGTDDSFVDLAGYAACGGELLDKQRKKNAWLGNHDKTIEDAAKAAAERIKK